MVELLPMVFPVIFFALFGWVFLRVFSTAFGGNKGIEKMLKGRVTRELGVIETRKKGITTITTTAYELEKKGGERVLVLRTDARAPLGFSVRFDEYSPSARTKLHAALEAMELPASEAKDAPELVGFLDTLSG